MRRNPGTEQVFSWTTLLIGAAFVLIVGKSAAQEGFVEPFSPQGREAIAAAIRQMEWDGVQVGVWVEDFSGRLLFIHRGEQQFALASNTKLFTTAAALLALPADFRWHTSAYFDAQNRLWLVGGGDATFHILEGLSYPDLFLDRVAERLKQKGIREVRELILDPWYFDAEFQHPDWPQDQLRRRYAAPICGLPYGRGLVRMRVNGSTIYAATSDPVGVALRFLEHGLRRRGIAVPRSRIAQEGSPHPKEEQLLYRQPSPWSLEQVVLEINAESDNYLADHLLKTLGAELFGQGSFSGGVRAIVRTLGRFGLPMERVQLLDGSGLARREGGGNLASPSVVVGLLVTMARLPQGEAFVRSLAVGGVRGTLKNRFSEPPLRGRVLAKTGWINGSVALSGYLIGPDDQAVAFSILTTYTRTDSEAFRAQIYRFQEELLAHIWQLLEEADPASTPPAVAQAAHLVEEEPE
ncbi:MAG: peptidase M15 [Candidatus Poribacteria bacterium]|nr:MAG: peptidase M15 [Candidatus Poribacteria bacterium]